MKMYYRAFSYGAQGLDERPGFTLLLRQRLGIVGHCSKVRSMLGKKMVIIIVAVVLLVGGVAGGGYFFLKQRHADVEEGEAESEQDGPSKPVASKEPPVYVPLESLVTNVQDPNGTRMVQVGITLIVDNTKTQDRVKTYTPAIRSHLLMLLTQYSAETLLTAEGKESLRKEIAAKVRLAMELPALESDKKVKTKDSDEEPRKKPRVSPVQDVLYSSFIVQ